MIARDLVDAVHHHRQLGARHDAILNVVVRREASDRAGRALARSPQQIALGLTARRAPRERAAGTRDLGDRGFACVHVVGESGDLDEQHRPGILGVTGVERGFDGAGDDFVHDLERNRHDTGADHLRDGLARALDVAERRDADADRFGETHQAHVDRGNDAERPFAADQDAWRDRSPDRLDEPSPLRRGDRRTRGRCT